MNKFYFISYIKRSRENSFRSTVIDKHPIDWINEQDDEDYTFTLLSYQEITKEEFEKYRYSI